MLARIGGFFGRGRAGSAEGKEDAAEPPGAADGNGDGSVEGEDDTESVVGHTVQEIVDASPKTPERRRRRRDELPVVATPVPYDPQADTAPPPPLGDGASVQSDVHVAREEDAERGKAWKVLLRVSDLRARFADSVYERLSRVASPHAKNIHKDIRRTFPTHPFYAESPEHRAALHRVVSAYSVYDSIGYSQGIAFVAGYIYMHMSEADAFFSLVQLMTSRRHNLRELFSGTSPLLGAMLSEFDHQLELHMPRLAEHLRREGIDASMYAAPWFLTIFVYRFPVECLPIIWDAFVQRGVRVIFQVGLVILAHYHDTVMALDHEKLIPFFNSLEPVPPEVLRKSRRVRISNLVHVELPL